MLQNKKQDLTIEIDSSPATSQNFDEISEDQEPEIPLILLKDVPDRVSFLSSVGIIFLVYFSTCALVNIFLLFDMRMAKSWYRMLRLNILTPIFVCTSILIKLSVSFISAFRTLAMPLFVVDFVITFWYVLGIYFWLDERLRQYYIY